MKRLVMLVLVGLLLPIWAFGFDIFCKNNGEVEKFVLETWSNGYGKGSTILECDVKNDYRGVCETEIGNEGLTKELIQRIEPIYKQYVQNLYDGGICKVHDKDLNNITPLSRLKNSEVKKEPEIKVEEEAKSETEQAKSEDDVDVAPCYGCEE